MSIGEGIAATGLGLGLLANLVIAVYNYGQMNEVVRQLGNHVSAMTRKVDRLGRQVARIEGRLGLDPMNDDGGETK